MGREPPSSRRGAGASDAPPGVPRSLLPVTSDVPLRLSRPPPPNHDDDPAPVVIVGAGPVGVQVARELLRRAPRCPIVLYSAEPWEPYNRVLLSELLSGEIDWSGIANPPQLTSETRLELKINTRVEAIDRISRAVVDSAGNHQPYSYVVLALGSSPHVPALDNADLLGVYTYREVDDAQTLMMNAMQSRSTIVLGGGVLGIEVAHALRTHNEGTRIQLIHRGDHVMSRQLDTEAAAMLERIIGDAGIEIRLNDTVAEIFGEGEISGVRLQSGAELDCDTLVLCTGITPNTQLARNAGLKLGRGILVDDRLRTSDPRIHAVGECAEHRGEVYGLVSPGIEQATIAVANMFHEDVRYTGSDHYLRLKVVQVPVYSIMTPGMQHTPSRSVSYVDDAKSCLRKLHLEKGRITGATAVGEWPEIGDVHQAIGEQRRIMPWQLLRFSRSGLLLGRGGLGDPTTWPDSSLVCTCMAVSCGAIRQAIAEGFDTVDALRERTGASQACGSCRPALSGFLQQPASRPSPDRRLRGVLVGSALATILVAAFAALPPLELGRSAVERSVFDRVLLDPLAQQLTGYAVLLASCLTLLLTARKRSARFKRGSYGFWRVVHVLLGAVSLLALLLHTGLRLGENLNLALMAVFLLVALLGSASGASLSISGGSNGPRRFTRVHVALVWLLPALTAAHVFSVYYF